MKATQKELLFQRFLKEMQESMKEAQQSDLSNVDLSFATANKQSALRKIFDSMIVDPSFGLKWDEVPAPTLVGGDAMSAMDKFVAINGWNMQTNDWVFDSISNDKDTFKPIQGLPWAAIYDQKFPAVTHNGILYVFFRGFHHDGHGVAYNPHTNDFGTSVDTFKPIGQHWYAWAFDHEFSSENPQTRIYEGANQVDKPTTISN